MVKGGFSYRAKKELGSNAEVWQRGFADHRIRDSDDYERHVHYIHLNPVKKRLCIYPSEYRYSSAYSGWKLDPIPQGLKPGDLIGTVSGTAEAVPFQNLDSKIEAEAVPLQNLDSEIEGEAVPFQNKSTRGLKPAIMGGLDVRAEARTLQLPNSPYGGSR